MTRHKVRDRIVGEFARRVLEKYKGLVKSIFLVGSAVKGELSPMSDIDVVVILDDASCALTEEEIIKITDDLEKIAEGITEAWNKIKIGEKKKMVRLHVLFYLLTEFWDRARIGHPIVYNFIKEGVPIYDSGFFIPVKRLLEMGRLSMTKEAIEKCMEISSRNLAKAKTIKILMLAENCYSAMLNAAQAVLAGMNIPPPAPREAYDYVKDFLVKTGLLEDKYAE